MFFTFVKTKDNIAMFRLKLPEIAAKMSTNMGD